MDHYEGMFGFEKLGCGWVFFVSTYRRSVVSIYCRSSLYIEARTVLRDTHAEVCCGICVQLKALQWCKMGNINLRRHCNHLGDDPIFKPAITSSLPSKS